MWTTEKYQKFLEELKKIGNEQYISFSKKITTSEKEMIGVTIPNLRIFAKDIAKTDFESFLKFYNAYYFEETMLYGLTLGYIKDINILEKYLIPYAKEVTDWSLCDSPAMSMKLVGKNPERFLPHIKKLLESNKEFEVRFGLILLLAHYMKKEYIDYIIKVWISIKSDKYYINMALAWIICECYIKFPEETEKYISNKYLDKFVLNKSISKICDSFRVDKDKKELLKKRRI